MPRAWPVLAGLAALVIALPLAGCGSDGAEDKRGGSVAGDALTVYSSLPLRGPDAARMRAIVDGQKLALADAGASVGEWTIKFASLDDADGSRGWDPEATSVNARKAAQDPTTIAYIGDADFGATAISLPILNEAGVPQVSPASTYPGFTSPDGAAGKGEPDKYQPSGLPTFARVIPTDVVEGQAQALYQSREGCRRLFIVRDSSVEGRSRAAAVTAALPARGITLAGDRRIELEAEDQTAVALVARAARADCVFVSVASGALPVAVWRAVRAALPAALVFGPADLAVPRFLKRLTPSEQRATRLTQAVVPRTQLGPLGRAALVRYRERFARPAPVAMLYGYEAMALVLDVLRRAGDRANERTYVAGLLLGARRPESVLGPYAIRLSGDTTLRWATGFVVRDGRPVADGVLLDG